MLLMSYDDRPKVPDLTELAVPVALICCRLLMLLTLLEAEDICQLSSGNSSVGAMS